MLMKYAHHFHAYQPGDIVHVKDGDGSRPLEYEERRSPVAIRIRGEEVKGENWTRAMLYSYEHIADTLSRMEGVSIDIEPFTFLMLLRYRRRAFEDTVELLQRFDAVPTTPFHPIVPHLDEFEQRILARVSFDFYAPLIGKKSVIGYWLPEAVITRKTAEIVESSTDRRLVFLLDERQLLYDFPQAKHSCNRYSNSFVFGREWSLSDAFAFNTLDVPGLVERTLSYRDDHKENLGIPYLVFTASDLESLLGNPKQLDRFTAWMDGLEGRGVERVSAMEFVAKKLSGEFRRLDGECSFEMPVKDYSSWSDYFDLSLDGKTSDSRWLGYRRADGRVFAREARGKRISQLWKVAFTRLFEELNRAVRLGVLRGLAELNARPEEFLVRYARVFFRDYYDHFGLETSMDYVLEPANGDEKALRLGRIYYLMLLANHSCPRFWENLDTRVAFGNVSVMAKALIELMRYFDGSELQGLFIEAYLKLLSFDKLYHLWNLSAMPPLEGWETSRRAWEEALKPEVPNSGYNVVTRAALYVGKRDLRGELRDLIGHYNLDWAVADTGHIPGEVHGDWENPEWCEHRE
ncbi:glycoside hydrolase [Thermococcus sp. ES12]|uniref:glycoside hydrolase n=1 Tax=Thermococcus sp. ES12 TaxID=1638246 RepID=UPI00143207AA|nr:glycoside hydrolase [Thermococcus sp. ES12]NJE77305.1 glycoside hydrolase [Thermococcus sp. ES12]